MAETGLAKGKVEKIMETLFDLGELDKNLFEDTGVIWWQSFVDLLEDVYSRRKNNIPDKMKIFDEKDDRIDDEMILEYDIMMDK